MISFVTCFAVFVVVVLCVCVFLQRFVFSFFFFHCVSFAVCIIHFVGEFSENEIDVIFASWYFKVLADQF
jgi:hypothetical protein